MNQQPEQHLRIPSWLRRPLPTVRTFADTRGLLDGLHLHTVCKGAKCPNMHECFSQGTATFLIMGPTCTRNCRFCNIGHERPAPLAPDEPERVAKATKELGLRHVVITSVTRDDLPDGGAAHFAATVRAVRKAMPETTVEVLIPDFRGDAAALQVVMDTEPMVFNHNVETHPRLYPMVRPQADYAQSLELLRRVAASGRIAKSGFMVGIGESDEEVKEVLRDLKAAGCRIATVGQYMRPSREHLPVQRYVHPDAFEEYAVYGRSIGLGHVFSAPLVRSSYMAEEALKAL